MATTFTSAQVASTVQARAEHGVNAVKGTYEILAALVVNDVIQMVKVPANATILQVILGTDDLETSGTSCVLDVGDGGDTDRFIDGATVGQAGGVDELNEVDGLGYKYTTADTIDVLVQAAPATGATSGTINLVVIYHCYGFN